MLAGLLGFLGGCVSAELAVWAAQTQPTGGPPACDIGEAAQKENGHPHRQPQVLGSWSDLTPQQARQGHLLRILHQMPDWEWVASAHQVSYVGDGAPQAFC